jgi:hypothetical protein
MQGSEVSGHWGGTASVVARQSEAGRMSGSERIDEFAVVREEPVGWHEKKRVRALALAHGLEWVSRGPVWSNS